MEHLLTVLKAAQTGAIGSICESLAHNSAFRVDVSSTQLKANTVPAKLICFLASKLPETAPAFPVLQVLSFMSYAAEPSNYSEAVRTLLPYCTLTDDNACRVTLVFLGNLHRPDSTESAFRQVVELLLKLTQTSGPVSLPRLKVLTSTVLVLSQLLPDILHMEPASVANLFFSIQKLLTLGSSWRPFLDVTGAVSSSSEHSDIESGLSYTDKLLNKLRTCSLISLQELFKKHSKLLFSYWGSLFAERRDDRQMSLNYLLSQDHTKTAVAYTIAVIIDNSPLSKWVFSADSGKGAKGFTPFSKSVAAIVKNLHEDLAMELQHDISPHTLTALMKASMALLSQSPYSKMQPGLVRPLAQALVSRWSACDFANRGLLLHALHLLLQSSQADVEDLFDFALVQDIVKGQDFALERMAVIAKVARYFPCKLDEEAVTELIRHNLQTHDAKLAGATLSILEELASQPGPLAELGAGVAMSHVKNPSSSASSLNLLTSLYASNAIEFISSRDQVHAGCLEYLQACTVTSPETVAARSALFKFSSALATHPSCDRRTFDLVLGVLKKGRDDSSLPVSIQASATLAVVCTSPYLEACLPDLVSLAVQRSQSRKEKIASNGVVAVGNLLEHAAAESIEPYLEALTTLLLTSCSHKNIKVCWDSCKALLKASSRGLLRSLSSKVVGEGLGMLDQHPNFKTRIYICELLEQFEPWLVQHFSESASKLMSSISVDNPTGAASYPEEKHKLEFRQAIVKLLASLVCRLDTAADLSSFMNLHASALCLELHTTLSLIVHSSGLSPEDVAETPSVQLYRRAGKVLHVLSEGAHTQVSFGTVDRLAVLAEFSVADAAQLLAYASAADDVNIGLKSQLTKNLP
jgi:hypothetical protein